MKRRYDIGFGKVIYKPGAPKNSPRWIWTRECEQCEPIPILEKAHGPLKTRREAEHDAEQKVLLLAANGGGALH
jgi:hypothetical protein